MKRFSTDLYLILDPTVIPEHNLLEAARAALQAGVRTIQYRDKRGLRKLAYEAVSDLTRLTRRSKAVLIINDDLDLAISSGASGVHLGQEDLPITLARSLLGPRRIIGASAHTLGQARAAEKAGADYIGVGPIFESTTKQARPPLGLTILRDLRRGIGIPIFAVGGLSKENIPGVLAAGADGVACVSAVLKQTDIRLACQDLLKVIRAAKKRRPRRS